jgi:VWFA-related protein
VNCARPNPSGLSLRIPARLLAAGLGFLFSFLGAARARCQDEEKTPTLKVSTDVVNVYAIVRDKKGRLIANLNKEDFEISEDNVVQTIRYYSRETDTPLTLGLMIDTSPSQGRVLEVEKEEGKAFIRQVLRPKDLAFALHFDLEVELLQDFTSDARLLSRAIDESVINGGGQGPLPTPLPASSGAGATHLYDAIYLAANELLKNEVGRKVLNDALEASQKAGVIIYSVAIIDRAFYFGQPANFSGDSVLRKLSEETGGRVIEVSRTRDTAAAFQQIAEELRTEYLLGYAPANPRHDGSYRKIRVRLRNGDAKVQARRGYYAPTE